MRRRVEEEEMLENGLVPFVYTGCIGGLLANTVHCILT